MFNCELDQQSHLPARPVGDGGRGVVSAELEVERVPVVSLAPFGGKPGRFETNPHFLEVHRVPVFDHGLDSGGGGS